MPDSVLDTMTAYKVNSKLKTPVVTATGALLGIFSENYSDMMKQNSNN